MKYTSYINSYKNLVNVLDCFSSGKESMTVSEIEKKVGKSKSTVSKILSTLATYNIVVKSEEDGKYSIGSKIIQWASLVKVNLKTIARPYLEEINRKSNEAVSIFLIEGVHRICLDTINSSYEIRYGINTGQKFPIYTGSSSKVLLAGMPREKQREILKQTKLIKIGPKTITNRKQLENELDVVRKQGYAISIEERIPFAASVSVPVQNQKGEVIAALSIGTPAVRMTPLKIKKYVKLLMETAKKISRELD